MWSSARSDFDDIFWFFEEHRILARVLALALCVFALLVCIQIGLHHEAGGSDRAEIAQLRSEDGVNAMFPLLAATELDTDTTMTGTTEIDLDSYSDECVIEREGNYHLTGRLDGSVVVRAQEQNVHLFLDNVTISAKSGSALLVEDAAKVVITLLPDTSSRITDSGDYRRMPDEEACVESDCDLTINGTGTLDVSGLYEDAIRCRDVLKILGGDIRVHCKRTAFRGNDGILVTNGSFFIASEKYGLKTTNSGPDGRGNIVVSGGEMNIIAGRYAFVCENGDVYIYDCTVRDSSVVGTFSGSGLKYVDGDSVR